MDSTYIVGAVAGFVGGIVSGLVWFFLLWRRRDWASALGKLAPHIPTIMDKAVVILRAVNDTLEIATSRRPAKSGPSIKLRQGGDE